MNSAMGAASLALYEAVGSDRYLRPGEASMRDVPGWYGSVVWQTYTWQFGGFTGARLDPLFHRLDLATMPAGRIRFAPACALAIVGTGPSLQSSLPSIVALRDRLCLATSLRGADALRRASLSADLVIVEHATALDAQATSRDAARNGMSIEHLGNAWVALGRRTPPDLAARLAGPRTFVLDAAPSWGVWPATVAALGIANDVKTIGLIGVDLSVAAAEGRPLLELLSTLARLPGADVETFDCGSLGPSKQGWTRHTVQGLADRSLPEPLQVELSPGAKREAALIEEGRRLLALAPVVKVARLWLEAATRVRDGKHATTDPAVLHEATSGLMAWANDRETRHALIDTLALSFLPRLWRHGLLDTPPNRLWRPLVLALHELVTQAGALYARLAAPKPKVKPLGRVNGKSPFSQTGDPAPATGVRRPACPEPQLAEGPARVPIATTGTGDAQSR